MMSRVIKIGFLSLSFFCVFHTSYATEYTVSPLVIDIDVQARDIISKTITVTNTGTNPVTLYPTVNNISLSEGGTIEEFITPVESDRTQSLSSWIEVSRLGINLAIGESKTVPITFHINPNPMAGTYHALIGFGTGRNRDEAEKQVMAGQAPASVITVTIAEKKNEFLKLAGFIVDRFVTSIDNKAAVYRFKNPGDEVLVPVGEIIFYDSTGKEVGVSPVNAEMRAISPGEEGVFETTVPVQGLFGKYKAFLSVEYGITQRASVQDTSFFYVFPLKTILIAMGIILMVVIMVAWYIHRKYFDDDDVPDDSERLMLRVRDTKSEALHHDIDLKKQS